MTDAAEQAVNQPDETMDDIPIPALLRTARVAYGHAIRAELARRGIDDMPRNGAAVIGGVGNHGQQAGVMVRRLGVSKQAASQLVDTLVLRGYLSRETDPEDRRRLNISLTERGREAADAIRAAVTTVDRELAARLGEPGVAALHEGLVALCDIRDEMELEGAQVGR
jgi:DNA-binding MarR family transcriptional regulator